MAIEKWSEKKDELDKFIKLCNTPKIKESGFYPIVHLIKRLTTDTNMQV